MRQLAVIFLLLGLAGGLATAQPLPADLWRDAPEYLPIVAPSGPRGQAFRTYVSPLDIRAVLQRLDANPGLLSPPGAWQPRAMLAADAFGQAARYDRWKMARLFGATRTEVARGPRGGQGGVTESWTLISPYPDPALERLESGTLLIVLSLSRP